MKQLYLFGNLKMNMTKEKMLPYLKQLKKSAKKSRNTIGICVSDVYLPLTHKSLKNTKILYGAQNVYFEKAGAFTGETSLTMLKDYGSSIVLIGHSERRQKFLETDSDVNKKLLATLKAGLTPIVCVGETLKEREEGETKKVVKKQLKNAFDLVKPEHVTKVFIAYEPIWAIGTGVNATKEQAEEVVKYIKQTLVSMYNLKDVSSIKVLYGGSLNEKNAAELLSMPSIDGGLIGGDSLVVETFEKIYNLQIN